MKKKNTAAMPAAVLHDLKNAYEKSGPVMLRKSYDVSTVCYRRGHEKDSPMEIRFQGEMEYSLLRAVLIGTAVTAGISSLCAISHMMIAARYRRRFKKKYEEKCRAEKYKRQCMEQKLHHAEKTAVSAAVKASNTIKKAVKQQNARAKSAESTSTVWAD